MRFWVLISFLLLAVLGLIWKMVHLSVINRAFLLGQGEARASRIVDIPAYRGVILDRNGEPLAISIPVDSVWVNPKEWQIDALQAKSLAKILGLSAEQIASRLQGKTNQFVYLKRHLSAKASKQLAELRVKGMYIQKEYQRPH